MSRQQEAIRNDWADLKTNCIELSRKTEKDRRWGRGAQGLSLPLQLPPVSVGVPKSWWAMRHQSSATCKWIPPGAQKHLDFLSRPGLTANTGLFPPSQMLWILSSWDPTPSALPVPLVFPILCAPRGSPPRECGYSHGHAHTHMGMHTHTHSYTHSYTHIHTPRPAHLEAESSVGTYLHIHKHAPKTHLWKSTRF